MHSIASKYRFVLFDCNEKAEHSYSINKYVELTSQLPTTEKKLQRYLFLCKLKWEVLETASGYHSNNLIEPFYDEHLLTMVSININIFKVAFISVLWKMVTK